MWQKILRLLKRILKLPRIVLITKNTNGLPFSLIIPCFILPERFYMLKIIEREVIIVSLLPSGLFYVETRLLPPSLIEALQRGKRLREDADYYSRWSEEGAEFVLKAAKDFLKRAQELTKV